MMYVSSYTSRPVFYFRSGGEQRPHVLTFADAIERFGTRIDQAGLVNA
jgi:hypothetical protein